MSNLKLPEMDYFTLRQLINEKSSPGIWFKIGYQTWVKLEDQHIYVKHHDSVIADISLTSVKIDNHGYHTRTTANRLNKIVYANCGFHIGITNYQMVVRYGDGKEKPINGETAFYTKDMTNV